MAHISKEQFAVYKRRAHLERSLMFYRIFGFLGVTIKKYLFGYAAGTARAQPCPASD